MITFAHRAAHGQMPVPAPATLFLMQGMELCAGPKNVSGELITPTGACLIRALCGSYDVVVDTDGKTQEDILKQLESLIYNGDRQGQGKLPPGFVLESIGIGAGTKDFPKHPNIVRALIGRVSKEENTRVTIPNAQSLQIQKMICMEANIDDMTSEHLAHLCAILLESGANDVWQESIVMKKNRMACKLCALTEPSKINIIADCIFDNSTSIGVRVNSLERIALQRKIVQLDSKYGKVDVKVI